MKRILVYELLPLFALAVVTHAASASAPAAAEGERAAASSSAEAAEEDAAEEDAVVQRPAYRLLRQDEDWSVLARPGSVEGKDFFDPIKYVPLGADGRIWASFGGSLRMRSESWFDFAFGAASPPDDSYALFRIMAHGDVHFGETARLFVQLKSALSTGRDLPGGDRPSDVDDIALQQAFIDLRAPVTRATSLTLRVGRRGFQYGRQRLVSPLPWANSLRTWDGVSLHLAGDARPDAAGGDFFVDGFWSLFAPVRPKDFNEPDPNQQFFGVYGSGRSGGGLLVELYGLGLLRAGPFDRNGTVGDDDRYTLGTHLAGPLGSQAFAFDFEGAYQIGHVGAGNVRAFMLTLELMAQARDRPLAPRLTLGLDFASGDHQPGGGVQTFDPLYPLGHAYLGYMDFVGRQNVFDVTPALTLHPWSGFRILVAGHVFQRVERLDASYNAGGVVVRRGAPGTSLDLGAEIDVVLRQQIGRHLTAELGYGHFFPREFLRQTGPSAAMDFLYFQLAFRM